MVDWTSATIASLLETAPDVQIAVTRHEDEVLRRITPEDIDFWLRKTDGGERNSLGDRIANSGGEETLKATRAFMHRKLDFQEVHWKTVTAMVRIGD